MGIRKSLVAGLLASLLAMSGGAALAQDATPAAEPVAAEELVIALSDADGMFVANAVVSEVDGEVTVTVAAAEDSGLEPGERGIHIHETGLCETTGDTPFESAGDHFNPTGAQHGGPEDESHAGDLGNLTVEEDGTIQFSITTDAVTLEPGMDNSLTGEDGSALLIHAEADDLETDPSGESGDRVACGVIAAPADGGATPEASPVS